MSADLTTTELVERALSRERFQSALLLPFGFGSALLAALGVFGMVSDTANRRRRELALRQALGAKRSRVLAELLRSTLACVLTGLCIGMLLAIAAGRTLHPTLFGTAPANPWIVAAVCFLVLGALARRLHRPGGARGAARSRRGRYETDRTISDLPPPTGGATISDRPGEVVACSKS